MKNSVPGFRDGRACLNRGATLLALKKAALGSDNGDGPDIGRREENAAPTPIHSCHRLSEEGFRR